MNTTISNFRVNNYSRFTQFFKRLSGTGLSLTQEEVKDSNGDIELHFSISSKSPILYCGKYDPDELCSQLHRLIIPKDGISIVEDMDEYKNITMISETGWFTVTA